MKVDVFNIKNEKAGSIELSEKVYATKWNSDLVHQAMVALLANRRDPWAHVKTRGEVSGGGKKPWKQKGTGRARHGSNRSPIWVGGGITHGPRNDKDYSKKINKKMNRIAIFSVLSKRLADNELVIVDSFENIGAKTKDWTPVLKSFSDMKSKTLLVLDNSNKEKAKAVSNVKNIDTIAPTSLNVYDLLKHKKVIVEAKAAQEIEKYYKI